VNLRPRRQRHPFWKLRRLRQLRDAAAHLRAPALAAPGPVSRRSFTGPAGQPPRLRVARQTLSSAAGHERVRAKFSPRTPANTGRPKLPPRKSPRPSPPCALMSADRRTWPQRRLARGRLEKSNGCKPATPDPPIDHSNIEVPAVNRGHRSSRTTRFSATPQDRFLTTEHRRSRFIRNHPAPPIPRFSSESASLVKTGVTTKSAATPALALNRPSLSIPRFSSESATTADSPLYRTRRPGHELGSVALEN